MPSPIKVTIEGAKDSSEVYDDEQFLDADQAAREALINLYDSGATVANIAEAVQGALIDCGADI